MLIHATCVEIDGKGILLLGPSGSGKSDLALRLMEAGGKLIADDQTEINRQGDVLIASCPKPIQGRMEVRGVGLVPVDAIPKTRVVFGFDLVNRTDIERLPTVSFGEYEGVSIPKLALYPFEASSVAKVRLVLRLGSAFFLEKD